MSPPPVVIIMGPPGSGKTTQAKMAAETFRLTEFDTGGVIRSMQDDPGPMGEWVRRHYAGGRLAPPPLVTAMVVAETTKRLEAGQGMVFHGSPRSLREAEALRPVLVGPGREGATVLLFLETPKPETVRRIMARGPREGRADDSVEGMEQRWEEFIFRTLPARDFLVRRIPLLVIDGDRPVPAVTADVQSAIRRRLRSDLSKN